MGDKSKLPQRIVVFDDDHEDDLQTRKKRMEDSPKGMLDTPPDMTSSAWLRTNTVDFYTLFNNVYCTALDDCTPTKCPKMRAGPKFEFLWAEGEYRTKPTHLPAREYIKRLVQWAQTLIDDPKVYPPKDAKGTANFNEVCARIWSRTIRIVMHIYCHHWQKMIDLEQEELVNEFTKHFIMFALKNKLISRAEYVSPIYEVLNKILPANYKSMLKAIQGASDDGKRAPQDHAKGPSSPSIKKSHKDKGGSKESNVLDAAIQARRLKEQAEKERKEREEKERRDQEERRKAEERRKREQSKTGDEEEEDEDEEELLARLAEETGSMDILSLSSSQNNSDIQIVLEMIRREQARQEGGGGEGTEESVSQETRKKLAALKGLAVTSPPLLRNNVPGIERKIRAVSLNRSKSSRSTESSPRVPATDRTESLSLSPRGRPPSGPTRISFSSPNLRVEPNKDERNELMLLQQELTKQEKEDKTTTG